MVLPYFLRKSICRLSSGQQAWKLSSFDEVKSLLVLVSSDDAQTLKHFRWIRETFSWVRQLIVVQITNEKKFNPPSEKGILKINKKSFSFFGIPTGQLQEMLAQNNFDLVVNADDKDLLSLHVVAAAAASKMKIGSPVERCKALYPISLYSQEAITFEQYIGKCAEYLNALAGKSKSNA
jgi:hypothetical protein